MKSNFTLRSLFVATLCAGAIGVVTAQTPASATWSLATDPTATPAGNVSGSEQMLGPLLSGVAYGTGYGNAANNNQTSGWQRVGTSSSVTVGSESAFTNGSYVEYAITPMANNYFQVRSVSAEVVGGGTGTARLAAMYSLDNFTTMDSFPVVTTYNSVQTRATRMDSVVLINGGSGIPVLTGQQVLAFDNMGINVAPNQTFRVRFYVWLTGASSTTRHFGERNVVISGVTSSEPLPVTFSAAKAFQKNNGVQVEWSTASELNLSRFVVEKSTDGRSFNLAGVVAASGNSTAAKSYQWFDASPEKGNNFYRIKSEDKDGTTKYTNALKVTIGKNGSGLTVLNNPVRGGVLNLNLTEMVKGMYKISLYNAAGQKMYAGQLAHDGGSATHQLQLPNLKHGVYTLEVSDNLTRINKRLLIQ